MKVTPYILVKKKKKLIFNTGLFLPRLCSKHGSISTHLVFSITQEVLLCDLFAEVEKEGQRDEVICPN